VINIQFVDSNSIAESYSGCETPGYACFGCPRQDYCPNAYSEGEDDDVS
jgi:hypothetical protein